MVGGDPGDVQRVRGLLDVPTVLGAINEASGRSGSTENKWPNFIVPQTFDSGFSLRLMLKDMRIALGLASSAGPARLSAAATRLWAEAAEALPEDADHTEIARWLEPDRFPPRA
jgi:3-hydroxyisobutyrate dehydrogenase